MELSQDQVRWICLTDAIFVDPVGRVFEHEGCIYRAIYPEQQDYVQSLFDRGVVAALVEKKLLVETTVSDLRVAGYPMVLQHKRVRWQLKPHTWSIQFLRKAALHFVELNLALLEYGLGTCDGHWANFMQVRNEQPVWIDFGSIVSLQTDADKCRNGIIQFRTCFLHSLSLIEQNRALEKLYRNYTLNLSSLTDEEFHWISHGRRLPFGYGGLGRVSPATARAVQTGQRLLSGRNLGWVPPAIKEGVGAAIKTARGVLKRVRTWQSRQDAASLAKERAKILRDCKTWLEDLRFQRPQTQWGRYHRPQELNKDKSLDACDYRAQLVEALITRLAPRTAVDIAANAGKFALLMAKKGVETYAFDVDQAAIDKLSEACEQMPSISLTVGVHSIYGADGPESWNRLPNNACGELALALAITHHLLITAHLPHDFVAKSLAQYCSETLLTEFMPYGLGNTKYVPDPLPEGYSLAMQLEALGRLFGRITVIFSPSLPTWSFRIMLLCEDTRQGEAGTTEVQTMVYRPELWSEEGLVIRLLCSACDEVFPFAGDMSIACSRCGEVLQLEELQLEAVRRLGLPAEEG